MTRLYFEKYLDGVEGIINNIKKEKEAIEKVSKIMADCIYNGGFVHLFGSGHSVIPALDAFPRYGSFIGLNALTDPRLMWFSPTGPASAPGLLIIERKEGYVKDAYLRYQPIRKGDVMIVYSHGGVNAAPVEAALYGKEVGAKVVAVTSLENQKRAKATHSSGKKLSDIADVLIDNCVPHEDAIVSLEGRNEKVGATSSIATIAITQSLLVETATILNNKGYDLKIFVSPNVPGFGVEYNITVFDEHNRRITKH